MAQTDPLPIKSTLAPADQQEAAELVRAAHAAKTPLYPIGGGTSLNYGLPPKAEGKGFSLAGLTRVVDYPARDMTVTVEAGVSLQTLAELLARERQRLPIEVPQAAKATVGGVVATNWNGPRRFGLGTVRDYVIGISAIDGRGAPFQGGGRVVKNVAGYDFCKLLTGSLGTLGIITQITFKLKPIPEQFALLACAIASADQAEQILAALVNSATTPVAVELLAGPAWEREPALQSLAESPSKSRCFLVAALEGAATEVAWMTRQLHSEWTSLGVASPITIGEAGDFWRKLVEFSAAGESPLVLKASLVPSGVAAFITALRQLDPDCSIQAHAGNGIVIARLAKFPERGLSRALVGDLQTVAAAHHGQVMVLENPSGAEMTRQSVWGGGNAPFALLSAVKRKFDPHDILNRGRFVYS